MTFISVSDFEKYDQNRDVSRLKQTSSSVKFVTRLSKMWSKKLIKHYKSVLKLNQSSLLHYGGHFLPLWYEKHRFFVQKTVDSGQIIQSLNFEEIFLSLSSNFRPEKSTLVLKISWKTTLHYLSLIGYQISVPTLPNSHFGHVTKFYKQWIALCVKLCQVVFVQQEE